MTNDTNAANNSIPKYVADPKAGSIPFGQAQSTAPGFHPDGIDNNNGSIFYPILAYDTDNESLETLAGDNEGIELGTNLNTGPRTPNSNPTMPRPGSRLIDQSSNRNHGNF